VIASVAWGTARITGPVSLTSTKRLTSILVDGGLLSNFPIDSLDRTDGKKPRWPTFGVTVVPSLSAGNGG
jgi:NTE family protein